MLIDCKPLAEDSNDHLFPWGAANDETHHPAFVTACERIFPNRRLRVLDLGCAGGGMVEDFLAAEHRAYGLEGSTAPQAANRKPWCLYPDQFATCDIGWPFRVRSEKAFDVITAWEVLEHIPEDRLHTLLSANVRRHLASDGIFVASISLKEDVVAGVRYHVTVRPEDWWIEMLRGCGLRAVDSPFSHEEYVRRDGCSAHVVAQKELDC